MKIKPGAKGGVLIRRVVLANRKLLSLHSNLGSYIHIAVSAGLDSTALAVLLARYGGRVGVPSKIKLHYIHHHWREEAGEDEARFVKQLAAKLGVGFERHDLLPSEVKPKGKSSEEAARNARKRIYAAILAQNPGRIVTGHHADDVLETWIWRLFEGTLSRHLEGILPVVELTKDGVEWRPFLSTDKAELEVFLREEKQEWCTDQSNFESVFLRSQMRGLLFPVLDKIFKGWRKGVRLHIESLTQFNSQPKNLDSVTSAIFAAAQLRPSQAHWKQIQDKISQKHWSGELELGQGWRLTQKGKVPKDAVQWKLWRHDVDVKKRIT